jgi:hypothetical protein
VRLTGGVTGETFLEPEDLVDHVRDSLQWRVATVEEVQEALEAEDGIVAALRDVEQVRRVVPRVVTRQSSPQ